MPVVTATETNSTATTNGFRPGDEMPEYLWTLEEFHRLIASDVMDKSERLELLAGKIYRKMGQKPPHSIGTGLVSDELSRVLSLNELHLRVQMPVSFPNWPASEPEPDVAVVRGQRRQFATQHPQPEDILLIVEVADTTLSTDRTTKMRIYAEAGIVEYWILNLRDRCLEVYRDLQNGVYQQIQSLPQTQTIAPCIAPSAQIAVLDLLP